MSEDEEFRHNVTQALAQCGLPPLIGTFTPQLGDIGSDPEKNLYVWDGKVWIGATKRAKTFEEWWGFDLPT